MIITIEQNIQKICPLIIDSRHLITPNLDDFYNLSSILVHTLSIYGFDEFEHHQKINSITRNSTSTRKKFII